MTLTFLGTRGEIEARTRRHRMHTSLLVSYRVAHVMIDCGLDWLGKFERLRPSAIVLTHAHPDHASGLRHGSPCPVHAPQKTWQTLQNCTIQDRHLIKERTPTKICGITFEAFPVEHSILAPAVGYRISAGRALIFYAPDLVFIHERAEALEGVQIYIGDGATITRTFVRRRGKALIGHSPVDLVFIHERAEALEGVQIYIGDGATITRTFVRRRGKALIGHSPVRTQLTWCQKEGVPRAIITHCGSEIVNGDEREIAAKLRVIAAERRVEVRIAYDGMKVKL